MDFLRISYFDPKKLQKPKKPQQPKKSLPTRDHLPSGVNTQTNTHRNIKENELHVLPEKELQFPFAETPSDDAPRPGACEIQNPLSITRSELSPGLHAADQHTLSAETDYTQVESVENNAIDTDFLRDFNFDFGDFNYDSYFAEQEARPMVEYSNGCATTQITDTPGDQPDGSVLGDKFERGNTPKRRRSKSHSQVIIDSTSDSGASESDVESVFQNSGSPCGGSPGSSLCSSNNDEGAATCSSVYPIPVADFAIRQNDCSPARLHGTSNPVHDIDLQIHGEDLGSDDDDVDELSRSPSWYRFRPSTATMEGTGTGQKARHRYIALVDVFPDREFHAVLGKEYIDGEVHYLVDWVPTLVRGHVLHKAKAQPLISQFESMCEAKREKRKRPSNEPKATDGTQRKRRPKDIL